MSSDSSGAESDGEDVPLRVLASRSGVVPQDIGVRPAVVPESLAFLDRRSGEIAAAAEDDASIARVASSSALPADLCPLSTRVPPASDEDEEDVPLRALAAVARPRKRACREPPAAAAAAAAPREDRAPPDTRASASTVVPPGASASRPVFAVGRPVRRAATSGVEARRSAAVRRGAAYAYFAAVRRTAAIGEEADEHECEFVGSCGLDAVLQQRQAAAEAADAVVTLD